MTAIGFVAIAGAATLLRVAASGRLNRESFPYGTLAANVVGSFALGLLAGAGEVTTVILASGALGSLTTFSTLAVETVELWPQPATGGGLRGRLAGRRRGRGLPGSPDSHVSVGRSG